MKQIELKGKNGKGKFALVDDEDFDWLNHYTWYCDKKGYAICKPAKYKTGFAMARLIMNCPKGLQVDHINHNKLDNRQQNLRICSNQENNFNKPLNKNNTSGYKGVNSYIKNNKLFHRAYIKYNYKFIHLGHFPNEHWAAMAYDLNARAIFGEFAKLNFEGNIYAMPSI